MDDNNNSNIYNDDEQKILAKVLKTRIDIIDSMTAGGVPDRSGDIRVLNEVLSSTDKMITDTANIRIKHDTAATDGAAVGMVVELLRQTRANKEACSSSSEIPSIPKELTSVTTVRGETDINPERLEPGDFVAPQYDANKDDT